MCNRVVQKGFIKRPGQPLTVKIRGPGGEYELPLEAIFGGPARLESKGYWIKREGAEPVIIPDVSGFGEKNKTTGQQGWMNVPPGSSLEGLLLPPPPGKEYRLVKVLTQEANEFELASLGNNRVPVVNRALMWNRVDPNHDEYPPEEEWVWTTDYQAVRKGKWRLSDPRIPLEEGKWEDEAGNPIFVMQWISLAESPNGPPGVPPPPRPITEIIAEESSYDPQEENPEEQADWWKEWSEEKR
jgi:hypothetical protein